MADFFSGIARFLVRLLLLAVGLASPSLGPQSLQWAYGALGVLALLTTLANGLADDPQTPPPLTWKDAS